ncbi:MAG TPA: thioredoxin family protein [Chitinophagaceae bacterium]|nr:thioredoxin family protein [Chitinophagaceae bacterium]
MRSFSILLTGIFLASLLGWEKDFEDAKKKAVTEHKLILLNFSGSDWCGPCIKLYDEIFENIFFKKFADSNLVLINADFPRLKKNQLSKDQQKKNDKLADKYNPQGSFPYTVLLTAEGKVIKAWDGYPNVTAERFTAQIKELLNARK